MLLIGSRAIRFHLPSFREPRDWDLIATDEELAGVASRLPANRVIPKPGTAASRAPRPPNRPEDPKHFFRHGENLVEVARQSMSPYWAKVSACFADADVMEDPVLGPLRVAPLDFLLLTKQCGLVYPILHWHKNLRDVYLLRDSVVAVSRNVAALWPDAMADSARMFAETHRRRKHPLLCCHPAASPAADRELHLVLHRAFSRRPETVGEPEKTWALPEGASRAERKAALMERLAEEAQVVAVEQMLWDLANGGNDVPEADRFLAGATKWLRWTLRDLAIGPLPIETRYFLVNHYREIRDLVPARWTDKVLNLHPRLAPGAAAGPDPARGQF
jgi:hypothetical protein